MNNDHRDPREAHSMVELGVASTDTLGLPVGDIPEPMGLWKLHGIDSE